VNTEQVETMKPVKKAPPKAKAARLLLTGTQKSAPHPEGERLLGTVQKGLLAAAVKCSELLFEVFDFLFDGGDFSQTARMPFKTSREVRLTVEVGELRPPSRNASAPGLNVAGWLICHQPLHGVSRISCSKQRIG
jgi:hypothetical protein